MHRDLVQNCFYNPARQDEVTLILIYTSSCFGNLNPRQLVQLIKKNSEIPVRACVPTSFYSVVVTPYIPKYLIVYSNPVNVNSH